MVVAQMPEVEDGQPGDHNEGWQTVEIKRIARSSRGKRKRRRKKLCSSVCVCVCVCVWVGVGVGVCVCVST